MNVQTWTDVYTVLHITQEDIRLTRMVLLLEQDTFRKEETLMCTLAEASDLIEYERDVQAHQKHARAMRQAVLWGENGHIPDTNDILDLHAMLFKHGGEWRTCNVIITGSRHVPPPPVVVPMLARAYVDDARWWLNSQHKPYVILAHLHLEFTKLHPFTDGNGRVGRMLLNSCAAYLNLPAVLIANRERYLDLLQDNDENGLAQFLKESSV
jgi:Fic family protein